MRCKPEEVAVYRLEGFLYRFSINARCRLELLVDGAHGAQDVARVRGREDAEAFIEHFLMGFSPGEVERL